MMRRWFAGLLLFLSALGFGQGLPFENEIRAFEAQDRMNPPTKGGILFLGSSSIRLWSTLATDFPGQPVVNRGFGGSSIRDSIRYADRIVFPYEPKMVVFFAGSNDLASGRTPDGVADDLRELVAKLRARLPQVRFVYLSITPAPSRRALWNDMREANRQIREFCVANDGMAFVDAFPYFLSPYGGPRPELFVQDQLHLSPEGYAIWRKLVAPLLPWSLGG